MSWRGVVWCCCLGVAIGCASGHAERDVVTGRSVGPATRDAAADDAKAPDARQAHDSAVEVTPCENVTSMRSRELYLGDGITDYHYYPIVDYLRENPGSESNTRDVEHGQRAAAQSPLERGPCRASQNFWIHDLLTGAAICFPGLAVHLIRDHCFFEGDVFFRVDPQLAARVVGLHHA